MANPTIWTRVQTKYHNEYTMDSLLRLNDKRYYIHIQIAILTENKL